VIGKHDLEPSGFGRGDLDRSVSRCLYREHA
jgi:hypothetical protein